MLLLFDSIGSLSLSSACGVFVAFFVLWYTHSAMTAWYRLRHIPGPFLASFSYFWMVRSILFNRIQQDFTGLIKYGSIVRIGPNSIVTSDPEILRQITSARTKFTKNEWYSAAKFAPDDKTLVTSLDNESHDTLKAKAAGGYNGRENTDLEAAIDSQIAHFIEVIRCRHLTTASEIRKVDFAYLARFFTLDVITRLTYGKAFGFLDAEDLYGYASQIDKLFKAQNLSQEIPFLRKIVFSHFFFGLFGPKPTDESGVGKIMGITQNIIRERFQDAKPANDMMGSFIRHGMTEKECRDEALLLIAVGSDTTAIRTTLMYIMTTPRVYVKLKDLITRCVDNNEASSPITYVEAQRLPYLQAVILEGLRMRFPATYGHYKQVPPEGDTINGIFIPGGTAIGHNSIALTRTASIFGEDVDVFRPERFLECDEEKRMEMERAIDIAFGHGRWMCAGKRIAFMELSKVLFELLRAFDFQLIYPQKAWDERTYFIPFHKNMWVRITEAI
ncbi:cytochrome P450 [Hypomontagnella submonticulosa]|nr:cytochrome P450 [Hypomontagnella submonticulosa]